MRKLFYNSVKHEARGKVHVEAGNRHRSIIRTEKDPVINLCPDLEGSWLVVPKPMAPDTVGYWPKYTKFPGHSDLIRAPSDAKKLLPIKFLHYTENDLLKSFLDPATKLVNKDNYLWLNPEVFQSAEFHNHSSNNGSWIDRSLRAQLLDNLITDELIDMSLQLIDRALDIPTKNPDLQPKDITNLIEETLELLDTSVILSSASNLRGRHTLITSIVKNKLALRDEVLRAHSGGVCSKEILRGSNFLSPDLFGPLPSSLLTRCALSSLYMLSPLKSSSSGGQSTSSQRSSTSNLTQAAASNATASHRSGYNRYQLQDYPSHSGATQARQHLPKNPKHTPSTRDTSANRGFFHRKSHQRSKLDPVTTHQSKKSGN